MQSAADRREALKAVYEQARGCEKCPQLAATRTTVVFGAGNADADLMFVGEAPGANEDKQGLPFVGSAGKLLEKLLGEIGLARADVFIANVLKCRPPGNRDPHPSRDRGLPGLPVAADRPHPAARAVHAGELLDQAPARRPDRDHAPARQRRGAHHRPAARCGCTPSTTRRRRCTRRRCWTRCGPTSPASPASSPSPRRSQPEPVPEVEPEVVQVAAAEPEAEAERCAKPTSSGCSEPRYLMPAARTFGPIASASAIAPDSGRTSTVKWSMRPSSSVWM